MLTSPQFTEVSTILVQGGVSRAGWLARLLRRHGHQVMTIGVDEIGSLSRPEVDLVLVEVDGTTDGFDPCRRLRGVHEGALIAVSDRDTEDERLRALDSGCDDHVDSACVPAEIMARIDAVLRWVGRDDTTTRIIAHGPLRIDAVNRRACVDGMAVRLTLKEFDLLRLLASRRGEVISRREVLGEVWGDDSNSGRRSLDTHVSSLRRKVGRWACVTVKGYGMRIGSPQDDEQASTGT